MKKPGGILYFVQIASGGPLKVGFTNNVRMRVATLQTWCPYEIQFLCAVRANIMDEAFALESLAPHHLRGEWFHPHPFALSFLESVRLAGRVPGAPAPYPTYSWDRRLKTTLSNVVPKVWPNAKEAAAAAGLKKVKQFHDYGTIGERSTCKLIIAARKRGFHIDTPDLYEPAAAVARQYHPRPPRASDAKPSGRKRTRKDDFVISEAA